MGRVTADAAGALLRGVSEGFASFCGSFRLESLTSRPWASVTFSGARHKLAFSLVGEGAAAAADAFAAGLGEADFALDGHILADVALVGEERSASGDLVRLSLEALTVEDG